jgi:hypothetical protein
MKYVKVGLLMFAAVIILAVLGMVSCKKSSENDPGDGDSSVPATAMAYVAFAWNDLGMHCLNPTYDKAVILPPYNTLWVQVVKRGNPPQIVTSGVTVEYALRSNTYSYGKRDYGQFWDNCPALFGVTLPHDRGLNLEDPGLHNTLFGTMLAKGTHFQANGIPVVPVNDALAWDPYQVADITVKDSASGATLVQTRATVPTSDEISCSKCHGKDALLDVLVAHDDEEGTHLAANRPVLCAGCHGTPILGISGPGSSGRYLSQAIHGFHASKGAACYDCHPGATTKCSRSVAHTAADGNCSACHGKMSDVAGSVSSGKRTPWLQEPTCVTPASPRSTPGRASTGTPSGTTAFPAPPATAAPTPRSPAARPPTTTRPSSTRARPGPSATARSATTPPAAVAASTSSPRPTAAAAPPPARSAIPSPPPPMRQAGRTSSCGKSADAAVCFGATPDRVSIAALI